MSILKFKNPETGEWEKVGIPGTDITPEEIGAATIEQVQAAQSSADGAAQAAQNAQNTANSKVGMVEVNDAIATAITGAMEASY